MAQYLINNKPIVECHLMLPKIGAWMANDVLIDSDEEFNIGDSVTMNFLDQTFKGTVLDTGVFRGFQQCTIIGGSGKFPDQLESSSYNSIPLGQVVNDIARKTGHTVSTSSDQNLLNHNLVGWNILKMKASLALVKLLDSQGAIWRILPDGTLWIGFETYTPLNINDFLVIEKFPEQARWNIYNEEYLIQPLSSLDGNNIQQVEYFISKNELTQIVFFTNTFGDSIDQLTSQEDNILYNTTYRCSVVSQKSDGSLDLLPNPSNDLIKNGFSNVPIVYPFPGMKIEVPSGTICYVKFANNDPQYPRVFAWEDQTSTTGIKVHMIHDIKEQPAARKGDSVNVGQLTFIGMGQLQFTPTGGMPGMAGSSVTLTASVGAGSNQLSIGG